MGVDLILFHIKELGAAGYEHGQHILLGAAGVLPVILQQANAAHLLQQRLQIFLALAGGFYHLVQGHRLAYLHLQRDLCHLVRDHTGQAVILRILYRHLVTDPVRDFLT